MTSAHRFGVAVACAGIVGLCAGSVHGQTYDFVADWSDKVNPSGVWTYRAGNAPLSHVDDWQSGGFSVDQPAWATGEEAGEPFLPAWMRSIGAELFEHDWVKGDVVVHTTDPPNGGPNGPANLLWTSPIRGVVTVDAWVWMGRDIGRGNDWFFKHNGAILSYGTIFSGDPYSRESPYFLVNGIGGPGALTDRPVERGDTLGLEFIRISSFGDFVGVQFRVAVCIGLRSEPTDVRACLTFGNALFTVEAEGQGELTYQWRRDGVPIPVSGPGSNPTAQSPTLVVAIEFENQGEYDCVVTSTCAQITSAAGELVVCAADFNCDDVVNSTDVSDFINQWFTDQVEGTFVTDIDGNGVVNSTDVSEFINRWFADVARCG